MEQLTEFIINHWMLSAAAAGIISLLLAGELQSRTSGVKNLGPTQATQLMNHQDAIVLDVRTTADYGTGALPNAVSLPVADIPGKLGGLENKHDKPIIAYCLNGSESKRACGLLRKQGFTSVNCLEGGLNAWRTANMPVHKPG